MVLQSWQTSLAFSKCTDRVFAGLVSLSSSFQICLTGCVPFVALSTRLSDCKLAICLSLSLTLCLVVLSTHLPAICLSVCKYVVPLLGCFYRPLPRIVQRMTVHLNTRSSRFLFWHFTPLTASANTVPMTVIYY